VDKDNVDTNKQVGSRPVPDPTVLTTDQLRREITNTRQVIDVRIDSIEKAVLLLQTAIEKVPALIAADVSALRALQDEKFNSIQTQFTERDIRTEQAARDSKVAVDAALQAAKEAVGEQNKSSALAIAKSEAATTKQIDQITILIDTMRKGLDDKIDDMKERLTSIEGQKRGGHDAWGYVIGIMGLIVALGSLLLRFGAR